MSPCSLYTEKYSEGEFDEALEFINESLDIRTHFMDEEQSLDIACSKRVVALIIEEIALGDQISNEDVRGRRLRHACDSNLIAHPPRHCFFTITVCYKT